MAKLRAPLPLRAANQSMLDAAWREVRARRSARRRPAWRPAALAVSFAAACVLLIVVAFRPDRDHALARFEVGAAAQLAAIDGAVRTSFDDRSWLTLDPGSRARVAVPDPASVRVALERGRATVHVEPGGPRTWTVAGGPTTVTVVGTDFFVARSANATEVGVEHGVVDVRGPGTARRVGAGERVTVSDVVAASGARTSDAIPIESLPSAPAEATPAPSGRAPTDAVRWRALAKDARHRDALAELGEDGVARETKRASDAQTLLELADVARLGGRPALAVAPLERLLELHGRDPSAPVAAFTLGKLELDDLNRPDRAARAFATCIRLGPPQTLAEDAHQRRVEALAKSGDEDGAREAARAYRKLYPGGRHLSKLERWLGD